MQTGLTKMKNGALIECSEMKGCSKALRCLIFLLIANSLFYLCTDSRGICAEPMRTITDRVGRTVQIPVSPKRIACFFGPSYEKVFLLGSADKVVMTAINQPPWSQKLRPDAKKISLMNLEVSFTDPDVERLLTKSIDLVFYWQWPRQTEKMLSAGIPVVCPLSAQKRPDSVDEFVQNTKDEMRFYGEVLGPKAKKIAAAYCDYYDSRINLVLAKTKAIPAGRRPKVYFATGRNVFGTQGKGSMAQWTVGAAGGTLVSKEMEQHQVDVSMEQIIAWNPDVVVIGTVAPLGVSIDDPRWKGLDAVKGKRIYSTPEGVFSWSHGSSESFLLVMWLAKMLHPDLFRDLDIVTEVRDYYRKFYHYPLTAEEARLILAHQPPKQ